MKKLTQKGYGRTKLSLITAGLTLAAFGVKAGPPKAPAGYKWEVVSVLTDEFNDGWVDTNKWHKKNPTWVGRDPGRFKESQVSESGGYLRLKNTKVANTSAKVWVHTGFLASKKKSFVAGMYSECSMKVAKDGTVSGFWMSGLGKTYGTEIDVQEGVGWPANGKWNLTKQMRMNSHYHGRDWSWDKADGGEHWIGKGVGDSYHTYGVWWKDKRNASMYYNNKPVKNVYFGGNFDVPMQLNINTETQNWIGDPNVSFLADNKRNTTLVDFVRTWRLVKDKSSSGTPTIVPIGRTIALKANANNKYVCSDRYLNANQYPLAANRSTAGAWEKFKVVDAGSGHVYLKANSNGKYIYSNGSVGTWPLIASSGTTGTWGKYKWVRNGDNTVSLKCVGNGKYVCADKGADSTNVKLLTTRTTIGTWEKFKVEIQP